MLILRRGEGHRQATWLELFFDLAFVLCISALTHALVAKPSWDGLVFYGAAFVPVWWVWNQFTWYASHFDNDDLFIRLLTLGGVAGTLFLAQGIRDLSHGHAFPFVVAYIALHLLLLRGWARVWKPFPQHRSYVRLKIAGIVAGIVLWFLSLLIPDGFQVGFRVAGMMAQIALPVGAWWAIQGGIEVHQHHLVERMGLFAVIVLGECLLAISETMGAAGGLAPLRVLPSLLVVCALWWLYFDWRYEPVQLRMTGAAFAFNYGHFFVYLGLGLVAAGILLNDASSAWIGNGVGLYLTALAGMNALSRREVRFTVIGAKLSAAAVLFLLHSGILPLPPPPIAITVVVLAALIGAELTIIRARTPQP